MSGPAGGARERVARLLESKYGEQVDPMDHFPAAWAADADELLDVVADTTAGEAEKGPERAYCNDESCPSWRRFRGSHWHGAPLAARSGGAQDDGLRARFTELVDELQAEAAGVTTGMCREARRNSPGRRQRGYAAGLRSAADRLRRALAGPDDARQDGVG